MVHYEPDNKIVLVIITGIVIIGGFLAGMAFIVGII